MASKQSSRELLAQLLSRPAPPAFVLLTAPDTIRKERITQKIIDTYFEDLPLDPEVFNAEDLRTAAGIRTLSHAARSTSLFSPVTVIIIRSIDALPADRIRELTELLKTLTAGTCIIMLSELLPVKHALYSFCKKHDAEIKLEVLKGKELSTWITREFKQEGVKRVPASVVDAVAALSDGSLDTALTIIQHAALYSQNGELTHEELELLFPEMPQQNEFELIDLLQKGSAGELEIALQRLWSNGKNAFMFLGLLTRTYTRYITIRSLLDQGKNPASIRQLTGMKEWVFNKHLQVAKRHSFSRLQADLTALMHADSKLKNKSLGPAEVIAELASALRH